MHPLPELPESNGVYQKEKHLFLEFLTTCMLLTLKRYQESWNNWKPDILNDIGCWWVVRAWFISFAKSDFANICLCQFRRLGYEVVDYIADYLNRLETLPVRPSVKVGRGREAILGIYRVSLLSDDSVPFAALDSLAFSKANSPTVRQRSLRALMMSFKTFKTRSCMIKWGCLDD